MGQLKNWMCVKENQEGMSSKEFQIVLDDLNNKEVAIKGSQIFSITFSLVANVR